ncbi:MAG: hypothetical protein WDZ96_02475, partial [Acidimicrobiia bacterium]
MIWLQGPQWIRWTIAVIIAVVAVWAEFRGDGTVEHPFAIETIVAGEEITAKVVEMRRVPTGLLPPVDTFGYATRAFHPDEPITPGGVSSDEVVPDPGWWSLEIAVPRTAKPGESVQLVLIDSGVVVAGRIRAVAEDDPLGNGLGAVAVPPEHAVAVAAAAAGGRIVVL